MRYIRSSRQVCTCFFFAAMSSSTCSTRDANEHSWTHDHGVQQKSDLSVKANVRSRRKREFTPDELKDDNYWMKRSRNNEAAKRSRERRRVEERLLEERALQLLRENETLKAALSAVNHPGVGKETPYDAFLDYSSVRDSYVRTLVDFPGANRAPHYALSSRYFSSVPLPRMQSFPAASFPRVDNKQQRDTYLRLHALGNGNVPSSAYCSLPYENAQRKWSHGDAQPSMNFAPFSPVLANQCPAGRLPDCAALTRPSEYDVGQPSFATEPQNVPKGTEAPERVPTSPLLPHKLRYKVNKARHGAERALAGPQNVPASPGINM